jgi:hypothetical protein
MLPRHEASLSRLLAFNCDVLDQALAVTAAYAGERAARYAGPVGSHLRHVIEHYDALLFPATPGVADYDSRPRSAQLDRSPALAAARVRALQGRLATLDRADLTAPLAVRGKGGLSGEFDFDVDSCLGRELAFVASHAIHHYALLKSHGEQLGLILGANFGKAPATVAHERTSSPTLSTPEITTCTPMPQAA